MIVLSFVHYWLQWRERGKGNRLESVGDKVVIVRRRKAVMSVWESYCADTSLHGYQYIGRWTVILLSLNFHSNNRKERRPFWCLIVILSIVAAVGFLSLNIAEYLDSSTVSTLTSLSSSLDNIYYPSVTICNRNQIRFVKTNKNVNNFL